MSKLDIDSDNGEIRVDGYEYASSKVSVKTYGISSESSQTLNSADIRLTRNDGYTDNLTVTGGSNVTITRNNSDKFTIDSYNSDTTYFIESSSSSSPLGAKITLKDINNVMDNIYIVQGTGVGVNYSATDNITISNSGVTNLASGAGISVSNPTGSVTVAMSEVTSPRANDLTIGPQATQNVLATNVLPVNTTVELHGVILFAFNLGGATNTFDVVLSTSSGTIGGNTSRVVVGFACHAGPVLGSPGESTKASPTFTYPTNISNINEHIIRFSGIFQTDLNTPNSLVIRMKNNNAQTNENLVVYAKSFIRYNII